MATTGDEKVPDKDDKAPAYHEIDPDIPKPLADAIRNGSVSETIMKHSHDADEAMKAFYGHEGEVIQIDDATNRRLLRRIDWNLMPVGFENDQPDKH